MHEPAASSTRSWSGVVVSFAVLATVVFAVATAAGAARCPRKSCSTTTDSTPPAVVIAAPIAGSTVQGAATITGSASDNVAVARVDVSVDGGAFQTATGTSTWSWTFDTSAAANGGHTITARATDTSGKSSSTSESLQVANVIADTTPPTISMSSPTSGATVAGSVTVAGSASDNVGVAKVEVAVDGGAWSLATGTTSWSSSWASTSVADGSHTLTARATDAAGNATVVTVTLNVANAAPAPSPAPSTSAPNTQGSWVSPEGVHIDVASAGPWTISTIYNMLKANAIELDVIGPTYTIYVQDSAASQTVTSATSTDGVWQDFKATTYLNGVNSTFANQPDAQLAYEYGAAWSRYHLYMTHGRDWTPYLTTRWSTADGSVTIGQDSRLDSTMSWDPGEMICDDYRLLFGSTQAIAERPTYVNTDVVDPRNQPGLRDWFLSTWA